MNEPYKYENAELSQSCRLLARTIAETKAHVDVIPGIVNNTYILLVKGKKPYSNMKVVLSPLTYVVQPAYWGVEVLACVSGILLPEISEYDEDLALDGIRGKKGIEVIFSGGETVKLEVPKII